MNIKVIIGCYLILIMTALFNKHIIDTQDRDDIYEQDWHIYQLFQLSIIFGFIAYITKEYMTVVGFAFTWAFFYDGLLNWFRRLHWFYEGDKDFGSKYTIPKKSKIIMLIVGIIIWILK